MERRAGTSMTMEAELTAASATAQLVHFRLTEPVDAIVLDREPDGYRIDLCLTPRPHDARGCYREHWGPHRFERIGDVYVLPPGETLEMRSDCGRQTSILCHLRPEPIRGWFDGELHWATRRLEESLDVASPNLRSLLLRLAEEARHPGFASEVLVELIAVQMAIELRRYCTAIEERATTGGLARWRLRLIDERLREVREAPTLAELAELCRLSVRQLTHSFRASRGCSIGEYVAHSQIDHAKQLLVADRTTIKSIAYSLGFSSPSAFSFAFRRATGLTPSEFRLRMPRAD
jgi:AraC family transcriptional regulator